MLQLVSKHTGLPCVSLIAGAPPREGSTKYTVAVVHYGKTNEPVPRDLSAFDPEGFKTVMLGHFAKFLAHTVPCAYALDTNYNAANKYQYLIS